MKKKFVASCIFIGMITMLTGCTLATPVGTLTFDSNAKSDKIIYTDDSGKTQEIKTDNISEMVDDMLDSTAVPNGDTEGLKSFVYDNLQMMGVDLNNLGKEDVDTVQSLIDDYVEQVDETTDAIESEEVQE